MSTEIDTKTQTPQWLPYAGESWDEMAAVAAVSQGADLVPGEELKGVPFIITSVTFRPGDIRTEKDAPTHLYYVSLELVTGTEAEFERARRRKRINESCPIEPGEELIFNDGSTGVYRQIVRQMEGLGWIRLPDLPENGEKGESRYDALPSTWEFSPASGLRKTNNADEPSYSAPVRFLCKRGLRLSEYEGPNGKEARTFYIA